MNFANLFATEKEMEDRALQLKREGRDIHADVSDWSYVNSKHQSLRSRKPVEEAKSPPVVESEVTVPPMRTELPERSNYIERRGGYRRAGRGRGGYYGQRHWVDRRYVPANHPEKESSVETEQVSLPPAPLDPGKDTLPPVETMPYIEPPMQQLPSQEPVKPEIPTPQPLPEEPVKVDIQPETQKPVQDPPSKPYNRFNKQFPAKKWVKKTPVQTVPPVPEPVHIPAVEVTAGLEDCLKDAEAQAQKMTMELVDQSDESIEPHGREIGVQTDRLGMEFGTQTEAGLIWRDGIPCVLVPLASMDDARVQVTMLGNPAGLFRT